MNAGMKKMAITDVNQCLGVKTPREELGDYWDSYDKTDCKHYKTNLDKLAEVYVIDKELKQDD